jgi:hypothetical protein
MQETTIYVELMDEGTIVFVPVLAVHLGERFYKILEHKRADDEKLRFDMGTFVFCLLSKFSGDENLVPVTYCEVNKELTENVSSNLSQQ